MEFVGGKFIMWMIKEMNQALKLNGFSNLKIQSKKCKNYFGYDITGYGLYLVNGKSKQLLGESDFSMYSALSRIKGTRGINEQTMKKIMDTFHSIVWITLPSGRKSDDYIYYVLGIQPDEKVYLVHIDPILFNAGWNHETIQQAMLGTSYVSVLKPIDYQNNKITAEVIITLDNTNSIQIKQVQSKYT